jgi:hypothetical protein
MTADQMAPDASPGEVSKKSGVRRVNNMPMYILGGRHGGVPAGHDAGRGGSRRQAERTGATAPPRRREHVDVRQGDRRRQTGGMIQPASPLKPPELPTGPGRRAGIDRAAREPGRAAAEAASRQPAGQPPVRDDEAERIRMAKLQMFEEAVKAKTGVRVDAPRSSGSAPGGAGHAADAR